MPRRPSRFSKSGHLQPLQKDAIAMPRCKRHLLQVVGEDKIRLRLEDGPRYQFLGSMGNPFTNGIILQVGARQLGMFGVSVARC